MTHVIMPGSDSKDSGFGDDLALPSTQAARISSTGPASGKKTKTKARLQAPLGRCELGASRWSA